MDTCLFGCWTSIGRHNVDTTVEIRLVCCAYTSASGVHGREKERDGMKERGRTQRTGGKAAVYRIIR